MCTDKFSEETPHEDYIKLSMLFDSIDFGVPYIDDWKEFEKKMVESGLEELFQCKGPFKVDKEFILEIKPYLIND
jgi:hypothetical protein